MKIMSNTHTHTRTHKSKQKFHGKKILTKKVREFHMLIKHKQTVL